jgi:hypothetical protein
MGPLRGGIARKGRAIAYGEKVLRSRCEKSSPHPCPLPSRGRETLSPTLVFWSPPPLRGRDRVGGILPAPNYPEVICDCPARKGEETKALTAE